MDTEERLRVLEETVKILHDSINFVMTAKGGGEEAKQGAVDTQAKPAQAEESMPVKPCEQNFTQAQIKEYFNKKMESRTGKGTEVAKQINKS